MLQFPRPRPGRPSGRARFPGLCVVKQFGIFLVGAALGKSVYASRRSLLPWRTPRTFVNFAGRHSLLIYIAHQPVIMGVLYLLGLVR
ncbi:MAG: DUF1624 domain-containing protein [Candidatus Aminicenantes bacterium]|nr:DUF1624 domain-containing protein [Candidatus Aminicenantes bacterium]